MASRARSDDRGVEPCAHPGQDRANSPLSTSSHPLGGGDGWERGMLGDGKDVGFDIDGNPTIQP